MIKINLANSLIAKSGGVNVGIKIDFKQLVIKLALLILPMVGMVFWEHQSINDKKAQLAEIQTQKATLEKQLLSYGDVSGVVTNFKKQRQELNNKFDVIRQIFGLRSQKLKTLFALQEKISPKTWLTQVLFHDTTVSVVGYSTTIDEAGTFSQALNDMNDLFMSVNTTNTNSEKTNGGDYFKFDIFIKLKE